MENKKINDDWIVIVHNKNTDEEYYQYLLKDQKENQKKEGEMSAKDWKIERTKVNNRVGRIWSK